MRMIAISLLILLLIGQFALVQFLEREGRRQVGTVRKLLAEADGRRLALNSALEEIRRDLAGMEDQRHKDAEAFCQEETRTAEALREVRSRLESLGKLEADMNKLLAREDAAGEMKRLAALLEEAPAVMSREDESRLSRAMEEGITNILGYAAAASEGRT